MDAALEVRRCGAGVLDAAAGLDQLQAGDALGICEFEQIVVATGEACGQGIGQGKELMHKAITC
ncbi:hypothetical protein KQ306_03930 [Synechococcus sp. CS-1324]|uniref:hypothetical protein n=1 Tax=Synechococcus sp. CS-1324 TaxID=2847980 RepID=UPI00223AC1EE|nr:hypothetical protein [Synechococcus sp. CS-1324]MCT0230012.1 hypothetical protein [Synechococcus sp. CS-1324]